jgi:hypothetical protein
MGVAHRLDRPHTLSSGAKAPRVTPDLAGQALIFDLIEDARARLETVEAEVRGNLVVSEIAAHALPAEVLGFGKVVAFICHC